MAKLLTPQTITVEQRFNREFDSTKPKDETNMEYLYHVVKTVNTIRVAIGQSLTGDKVNWLISQGVTVNVVPVK